MLKKVLCLTSVIFILFAIPGCSGPAGIIGEKPETATGSGTETGAETAAVTETAGGTAPEAAAEAAADKGGSSSTTLTFYIPGQEKKDSREVLDRVAEKCGLDIRLEFKYFEGKYAGPYLQEIKKVIASNKPFDGLYVGIPEEYDVAGDGYSFADMARDGVLADITGLLPQYAPDIFSRLDKNELEAAKIDGKLYAIPSLYPRAESIFAAVDPDLASKYGIGPLNTFEDYADYLKAVKENEQAVIPGEVYTSQWDVKELDDTMFMIPYGYVPVDRALRLVIKRDDPDLKIVPWEQTKAFKDVMTMLIGWERKGYTAGLTNSDGDEKPIASFLGVSSAYTEGPGRISDSSGGRVYDFYVHPLYKEVKIPRISPIGSIYMNPAIALNAESKNVEKALTFLNWVQSSQENYDLLIYGIKGKHYTLEGEKLVFPQATGADYASYQYWSSAPFRNMNYVRSVTGNERSPEDYRKSYTEFIEKRTAYAPNTGFYPDYRQLALEARKRIHRYQELIASPFAAGTFDPAKMDSIIQQFMEAGTDKLIEEFQKQFDEWRRK